MASASDDFNWGVWRKVEARIKSRKEKEENCYIEEKKRQIETSLQVTHHKIVSIDNVIVNMKEEKCKLVEKFKTLKLEQSKLCGDSEDKPKHKNASTSAKNQLHDVTKKDPGSRKSLNEMLSKKDQQEIKDSKSIKDADDPYVESLKSSDLNAEFTAFLDDSTHKRDPLKDKNCNDSGFASSTPKQLPDELKRIHDSESLENEPPCKKCLIETDIQQVKDESEREFERILF